MFKKLINPQVKMSDSALRDIIPSDDVVFTKKSSHKRFLNICKVVLSIFFLGLIAVGIVLLALILTYSGKSFMNFILQSSGMNFSLLANRTGQQENFTGTFNTQNWTKITVLPISSDQQVHPIFRTKQENQHTSMKSYPSLNTGVNEQSTSPTTPIQTAVSNQQSSILLSTTRKNHEYIQSSLEKTMTTVDSFTSTFFSSKIRDHQTTTLETMPLTTYTVLKSSTNKNRKTMKLVDYKKLDDDNLIDDLLFS